LLELVFHQYGHVLEEVDLLQAEMAGSNIQNAKRTHAAFTNEQRAASVEANPRPPGNLGIVGKTIVGERIRDDEQFASGNRVSAKGSFSRCLPNVHAMCRLEPLALPVDKAHKGDRYPEDAGGEPGKTVEALLLWRVKDAETAKSGEALLFVEG
jgi:hypothetical protein